MVDTNENNSSGALQVEAVTYAPESQIHRWLKYGANVVISSLIVIALAVLLTWVAESHDHVTDTTTGGSQSLRAQSVDYLKHLKDKVKIVALYPRLKSESHQQDDYQPVADLLAQYSALSENVTTEMIDPDTQKDAFNALVSEATNKYGGDVKDYKAILDSLPAQSGALDKFVVSEVDKLKVLPFDQSQEQAASQAGLVLVVSHRQLADLKASVDSELNQRVPSYKDGVDAVSAAYTRISQFLQVFSGGITALGNDEASPKAVRDYAPAAAKRADAARKIADAMLSRIGRLPPLKELDDFKTQLKSKSIIVMADSGYKILQSDQVWRVPAQMRLAYTDSDVPPKLNFAGEEEISAAIESLTGPKKPMIVFVRAANAPLTGANGVFGAVAQRLRDYNFDVEDKLISQRPQQQDPDAPPPVEPTDEQMKSAVWVVMRTPGDVQPGEPSQLNSMLANHLQAGGSALVIVFPTSDSMAPALMPWGIDARTNCMLVHEKLPAPERKTTDLVTMIQQDQMVFKLSNYGDHPIVKPLQGLEFLQAASAWVRVVPRKMPGITDTPLLPIPTLPQAPHSWAVGDAQSVLATEQRNVEFHPRADAESGQIFADIDNTPAHPLYGAAAAEKDSGTTRLVVVGSYVFASNDLVDLPDQDMWEKHGLDVARLPGNGEFFVNSIFWLSHMDSMLNISPHALQVARIDEMTPKALAFWRLGVLTAGLPAVVIIAGLLVYWRRQD